MSDAFQRDLDRFLAPDRPVALGRFHDGEYHVLRGEDYKAGSGWRIRGSSWMRERLRAALAADLPDSWIGISPPCDWPKGTSYFRGIVRTKQLTFATLFWHANFARFTSGMRSEPFSSACVVSSGKGDYRIPHNGVAEPWDLDGLVTSLLGETRPILLCAGPAAAIIVHEYWQRAPIESRQTILDVGSALDPVVHGRQTRHFQRPEGKRLLSHRCSWSVSVPWAKPPRPVAKGWRDHLRLRAERKKEKS